MQSQKANKTLICLNLYWLIFLSSRTLHACCSPHLVTVFSISPKDASVLIINLSERCSNNWYKISPHTDDLLCRHIRGQSCIIKPYSVCYSAHLHLLSWLETDVKTASSEGKTWSQSTCAKKWLYSKGKPGADKNMFTGEQTSVLCHHKML